MKNSNNSNPFQEINEYEKKTKKIGLDVKTEIISNLQQIETRKIESTQKVLAGDTIRIGEDKESTIVSEYWEYYTQFNSQNLPNSNKYYGDECVEDNITVLLNIFQNFYNKRIYPIGVPRPIKEVNQKNKSKPTKFFIVGDTHGSFKDTVKLIRNFSRLLNTPRNYEIKIIFVGDYIDRNDLDIHNLLYILTFNLQYPENVIMLRGNHEEVSINANYGFGRNVMSQFSKMIYAHFNDIFKDLPLIYLIHCDQGNVMILHGGIPLISEKRGKFTIPRLLDHHFDNRHIYIEDMDEISQQILWNDPIINYKSGYQEKFFNSRRGLGFMFGEEVFEEFCGINDVHLVFRGHQVFTEGIHSDFGDRFITVFSASDYVNKKIKARFIELDSNDIFNFQDHIIQDLLD